MLAFIAASLMFSPETALQNFLAKPDPSALLSHRKVLGREELRISTVLWQGHAWSHEVTIQPPHTSSHAGAAWLVITGDRVDSVDLPFGQRLADASEIPVVTLFNVPNQPLFDKREDDLIAYTFGMYLQTNDPSWPILFPMVKSAFVAMSLIKKATHGTINRFYVTGESKRGWTTWLVGCQAPNVHAQVVGIAPVSFDNLRLIDQLKYQVSSWGHVSEMLGDYTQSGVSSQVDTPEGKQLERMVDPASYLPNLQHPVLAIRGANDPYWATDAMTLYWKDVPSPKEFLNLPNEGHDFSRNPNYVNALAQFVQDCSVHKLPVAEARVGTDEITCTWKGALNSLVLWTAESTTKDFRSSHWVRSSVSVSPREHKRSVKIPPRKRRYQALYVDFVRPDGVPYSSTVTILPR